MQTSVDDLCAFLGYGYPDPRRAPTAPTKPTPLISVATSV